VTGATPATPTTPAPATTGTACPNCSTPTTGSARFCEACGYDTKTGKVPTIDPAAPAGVAGPVAVPWTATVTADRAYFDSNEFDDVEFPTLCPDRTFTLTGPQVRIGRASVSKGISPEMDLSAAPIDPGVSHSHVLLTMNTAGVWMLSDPGSTNGTYLNDDINRVPVGKMVALSDGDRIHLGAWTTITVHAPTPAA
jgi:hypothetical protein